MSAVRAFSVLGVAFAAAVLAGGVAARRMLVLMDAAALPGGWTAPAWPRGIRTTVPTDDGAELLVEISGPDGAPTVVLVHGLGGDHDSLGPIAEPLVQAGFRVVGVNQRGHGGSSVGTGGFGAVRLGRDLGQVLSMLDLEEVTLAGHSLGGVAAMNLVLLPDGVGDRVVNLVLVSTLAEAVSIDRVAALKMGAHPVYVRLMQQPAVSLVAARAGFGLTVPARVMVDHAREVGGANTRNDMQAAAESMIGYDVRHRLREIKVPTTVVCGTHDKLARHSENEFIAEQVPYGTFCSVDRAGHMIIWERPEVVVDVIAAAAAHVSS